MFFKKSIPRSEWEWQRRVSPSSIECLVVDKSKQQLTYSSGWTCDLLISRCESPVPTRTGGKANGQSKQRRMLAEGNESIDISFCPNSSLVLQRKSSQWVGSYLCQHACLRFFFFFFDLPVIFSSLDSDAWSTTVSSSIVANDLLEKLCAVPCRSITDCLEMLAQRDLRFNDHSSLINRSAIQVESGWRREGGARERERARRRKRNVRDSTKVFRRIFIDLMMMTKTISTCKKRNLGVVVVFIHARIRLTFICLMGVDDDDDDDDVCHFSPHHLSYPRSSPLHPADESVPNSQPEKISFSPEEKHPIQQSCLRNEIEIEKDKSPFTDPEQVSFCKLSISPPWS